MLALFVYFFLSFMVVEILNVLSSSSYCIIVEALCNWYHLDINILPFVKQNDEQMLLSRNIRWIWQNIDVLASRGLDHMANTIWAFKLYALVILHEDIAW